MTEMMQDEITLNDKVFKLYIPENRIQQRIKELARQINIDYQGKSPLFLAILNGSFIFASDLFKEIEVNCGISFVKLSSYKGTQSSGEVKKLLGIGDQVDYKDIIILEDIIDTGTTILKLMEMIREFKPNSLRIASLLYKENANIPKEMVDYAGFEIPPDFVVGYGLDYMELGRNLRSIYTLK